MFNNLSNKNIKVPNGFAITCEAYRYFIRHNNLESKINYNLDLLKDNNNETIKKVGNNIRSLIKDSIFSYKLKK